MSREDLRLLGGANERDDMFWFCERCFCLNTGDMTAPYWRLGRLMEPQRKCSSCGRACDSVSARVLSRRRNTRSLQHSSANGDSNELKSSHACTPTLGSFVGRPGPRRGAGRYSQPILATKNAARISKAPRFVGAAMRFDEPANPAQIACRMGRETDDGLYLDAHARQCKRNLRLQRQAQCATARRLGAATMRYLDALRPIMFGSSRCGSCCGPASTRPPSP
jgi:hypothetical protein